MYLYRWWEYRNYDGGGAKIRDRSLYPAPIHSTPKYLLELDK